MEGQDNKLSLQKKNRKGGNSAILWANSWIKGEKFKLYIKRTFIGEKRECGNNSIAIVNSYIVELFRIPCFKKKQNKTEFS